MWLLFIAAAAVALASSGALRVGGEPVRVGAGGGAKQGQTDVVRTDTWSCKKASQQPIPDLAKLVPAQAVTAGGPIAMVIVGGATIVKNIFEAIGVAKVCTVRGGIYRAIVVFDRQPARHCKVTIEPMYGGAPAGQWVFEGTRTDTGELPQTSKIVEPAPRQQYLMNGGQPPADLWPHVNIAKYQASVPAELDEPRVELVRSGDQLTLYVWLPPRAPRSEVTVWGKYKVLHPTTWRVSWALWEG